MHKRISAYVLHNQTPRCGLQHPPRRHHALEPDLAGVILMAPHARVFISCLFSSYVSSRIPPDILVSPRPRLTRANSTRSCMIKTASIGVSLVTCTEGVITLPCNLSLSISAENANLWSNIIGVPRATLICKIKFLLYLNSGVALQIVCLRRQLLSTRCLSHNLMQGQFELP